MQEQKSSCAGCGAELMPEARFCRKCGQPSNILERGSVTEVTTRRLGTPEQSPFMPGRNVAAEQSLEQQSSGQTRAALSAETRGLVLTAPIKRWSSGLVLLCILLLLPTFYLLAKWRRSRVTIVRPQVEAPAVPQPPKPPMAPAPGTISSTSPDPKFVYPGARTTMIISKAGEGETVQLQTPDALDKVADWYTDRLKPSKIVRSSEQVILKSDDAAIILTPNGNGTNIMLAREAEESKQ